MHLSISGAAHFRVSIAYARCLIFHSFDWSGCLRGGGDDVLAHRWFSRVDWETLYRCEIPAPFKPDVRSESDTRNFDRYPDSDGDNARPLNARERALFEEFDSM